MDKSCPIESLDVRHMMVVVQGSKAGGGRTQPDGSGASLECGRQGHGADRKYFLPSSLTRLSTPQCNSASKKAYVALRHRLILAANSSTACGDISYIEFSSIIQRIHVQVEAEKLLMNDL